MRASASVPEPAALLLAKELEREACGSVRAAILYGSHLSKAEPDRHSAVDLLVVVDSYRSFYDALAGRMGRSRHLMRWLSHVLAPNVIAYAPSASAPQLAKCLVLSSAHFDSMMGPRAPDHFVVCRMIQWVEVIRARTEDDERWALSRIEQARRRTLDWVAPFMEGPVDALGFARTFLEVCYRGEIRPETRGRASAVAEAQRSFLTEAYAPVLAGAAADGRLAEEGGFYRLAEPVPRGTARRWAWYFRRSRARASLRWVKHMITFDDWLAYLVRKVERHSGKTITLSRMEREWPLIFLWPRVISFMLERSRRRAPARVRRLARAGEEGRLR